MLKIGLAGCGRVARVAHLPALAKIKGYEIVAIAEPISDNMAIGGRYAPKATKYNDFRRMLDRESLDAVVIGLPNSMHEEAASTAMQLGTHIYLEKPLSVDLASAQRVVAVWEQSDVVAMMGLNLQHNPTYKLARHLIQDGLLGKLVGLRSVFGSKKRIQPIWRQSHKTGGGALLNLSPHQIDMVCHLLDTSFEEVFAFSQTDEPDETISIQARLANGMYAQMFISMTSYSSDEMEIIGEKASLLLNRRIQTISIRPADVYDSRRARLKYELNTLVSRLPSYLSRGEPSYNNAFQTFQKAIISNDRNVTPGLNRGLQVQSVIEAAWQSVLTNQPISITSQ